MEIERCLCGRRPSVTSDDQRGGSWVYCWSYGCWRGPVRKTERGAISSWNRVVRAAKASKKE